MQDEATVMTGSAQATIQMSAPGATQALAPIVCAICGQSNPPGEVYCVECGFLLSSSAPEVSEQPTAYPKLRDGTGREFLLKAGENLIGRDPSSDVLLSDGTVSRRHARIVIEENHAYLEDLGSTNGTMLNGAPLAPNERVPLAHEAQVQFGSLIMTVELPEGFETPTVAEEVAPPVAYLVAVENPEMRFPLYTRPQRIGRRAENAIVIPDAYVSGQHASIEVVGDEVRITDLGSTNGTYIGETRIVPNQPTPVPPDAILTLGKTQFRIEWHAEQLSETSEQETPVEGETDAQTTQAQSEE